MIHRCRFARAGIILRGVECFCPVMLGRMLAPHIAPGFWILDSSRVVYLSNFTRMGSGTAGDITNSSNCNVLPECDVVPLMCIT